eukprot:14972_1
MKQMQPKQQSIAQTNHRTFSISVMGVSPKQRSTYISTWVDLIAFAKKKKPVRTTYGQLFHVKTASPSISLELFVHDILNHTEMCKIWDSITLNVIVLPYNHTNSGVDKRLKQLIKGLQHTNVPLTKLFSKTLLICPSNFHSMNKQQYVKEIKKVREGLLELIHNELGKYKAHSLNLMPSDIIMMQTGRKSSILPIGKKWKEIAAEYILKHLIFNVTHRKAFFAWMLNVPKPLNIQDVSILSQKVKKWKTSTRAGRLNNRNYIKSKTKVNNNDKNKLQVAKKKSKSHRRNRLQNDDNQKRYQPQSRMSQVIINNNVDIMDRKEEVMDPDLAALLDLSDDETETISITNLNKIKLTQNEILHPDLAALLDLSDDDTQSSYSNSDDNLNNYPKTNDTIANFGLNWNHIISAIQQELNEKRALLISDIVNNKQHNINS